MKFRDLYEQGSTLSKEDVKVIQALLDAGSYEALCENEMKFQALAMAKDLHNKLAGLTFIDMLAVMSSTNPAKKEVQELETAINALTTEVGDFIQKYIPDVADAETGDTQEKPEKEEEPEEPEEDDDDDEEEEGMADEPEEEEPEEPTKDEKKTMKDNEKEIKEAMADTNPFELYQSVKGWEKASAAMVKELEKAKKMGNKQKARDHMYKVQKKYAKFGANDTEANTEIRHALGMNETFRSTFM